MCTPTFTEALFPTAKTWRQPMCPSTGGRIKLWNSVIKMNEIMPFEGMWMQLEIITLSQKKTNTIWYHLYVTTKTAQTILSTKKKQTHRHRQWTCGCQGGRWTGEGQTGSLRLADANCYTENEYTRSYYTAQGTMFNILG